MRGCLLTTDNNGLLAFLRLVGLAYFQKNLGGFEENNPITFFNSFGSHNTTIHQHHMNWYNEIRAKVSFEDHLPPTVEALNLHWHRTEWVIDYWDQSTKTSITPLPPQCFGWAVDKDNNITVEWDTLDNIQQVKSTVAFLIHGCNCKKGCKTSRCKCVKAGRQCGPGCGCGQGLSCQNSNLIEGTE